MGCPVCLIIKCKDKEESRTCESLSSLFLYNTD